MTATLAEIAGFAAIGFTVGAGYHFLLYRAVEAVVGGIAVSRMAAIQLLRLVAAGAIFWMIAQAGAYTWRPSPLSPGRKTSRTRSGRHRQRPAPGWSRSRCRARPCG